MSRMACFLLLVSMQVLILAGCGESNPLIGEWKYVGDTADAMEADGILMVIIFTDTSMIMGPPGNSTHFPVDYEVHENDVLVKGKSGNDFVVEFEDKNHISMETPHGISYLERR